MILAAISGCQLLDKSYQAEPPGHIKAEVFLEKGEYAYRAGELDEAEVFFTQALEFDPVNEQAFYRLGNIFFRKKDLKKSAQYFSKVVSLNPKNSKAHYNLGTIHLMFAEEHMKFFAATVSRDYDQSKVSKLLGDLNEFSSASKKNEGSKKTQSNESLDKIVNLIESN